MEGRILRVKFKPGVGPQQRFEGVVRILTDLIEDGMRDEFVRKKAVEIVQAAGVRGHDEIGEIRAITKWVQTHMTYRKDPFGVEFFHTARRLLKDIEKGQSAGDCLAAGEKVLCTNGKEYRRIPIEELEPYGEWLAVGYNFETNEIEANTITRVIEKGKRPVVKAVFKNGTTARITEDHPMYMYKGKCQCGRTTNGSHRQGCEQYDDPLANEPWFEKTKAKEMFESRLPGGVRIPNVAAITRLPNLGRTMDIEEDLLWLAGHYLAEGWRDKDNRRGTHSHKVSGHTPKLRRIMEAHPIGGSRYNNKQGVPQFRLKKTEYPEGYGDLLDDCGAGDFNKVIPPEIIAAGNDTLVPFLRGYADGDGHYYKGEKEGRILTYNTAPSELAADLRTAHLVLGEPLHTDFIADSMSASNCPMYRMHWNKKSRFAQDILPDLAKVGLKELIPDGEEMVYDISVENTRNFIHADSGVVMKNCDDFVILGGSLLGALGYPVGALIVDSNNDGVFNHVMVVTRTFARTKQFGNNWIPIELIYPTFKLGESVPISRVYPLMANAKTIRAPIIKNSIRGISGLGGLGAGLNNHPYTRMLHGLFKR